MTNSVPLATNFDLVKNNPALYAELWKEHVAAAIVQRIVRGHLARKNVRALSVDTDPAEVEDICLVDATTLEYDFCCEDSGIFIDFNDEEESNEPYKSPFANDGERIAHLLKYWVGDGY